MFISVTCSSNVTPKSLSSNVLAALEGVRFIAQHIRDADKDNEVCLYKKLIINHYDIFHVYFYCSFS